MKAVLYELKIIIKRDLMKKMGTTVAFNAMDQWWEEAEKESKVNFCIYLNFLFTTLKLIEILKIF